MRVHSLSTQVRNVWLAVAFFCFTAVLSAAPDVSTQSYVSTSKTSRQRVLEYCRANCEYNAAKPRLPYRATFEKALTGDFVALDTIFTNENYHSNDIEWTLIPWHILHVIGDRQYSMFVLSHPRSER